MALVLMVNERAELERRLHAARSVQKMTGARRSFLLLAQSISFSTITATVGCYPHYINRWKQRF